MFHRFSLRDLLNDKHALNTVWKRKLIPSNIGFTNPNTKETNKIYLSKMKHQTCVTKGLSRNLTDIP